MKVLLREVAKGNKEFCSKCISETTNEGTGNAISNFGFGYILEGYEDVFPICGSGVSTLERVILGISTINLGRYRIIYKTDNLFPLFNRTEKFILRKLKE